MRVEQYGPARIFRWSLETAYRMRTEARAHLLLKFRVGRYKDAGIANSILQHQFAYFSEQLMAAIPVLAARDSLEFILTQYEESATILHGAQISDPQQRENWLRIEGDYRRAMKFIAELIARHEPTAPSKATKEQSRRAMDQALLAAETLVDMAEMSNRVHGVFPNDSEATIHKPGNAVDYEVHVTGKHEGYDLRMQQRLARDRQHRAKFISGHQFDYHTVRHQPELDPAFESAFGWSYGHFIYLLRLIINSCQPAPGGFPTLFIHRQSIVDQLISQGAPLAAVERALSGFTVSPANMRAEGRVVWNPKQEHRAFRRGFLAFPHETGPHIAFSRQMAMESMTHLVHGVCYKRLPMEWSDPRVKSALERLSRQASVWFEDVVAQNARKLGIQGGRAKDQIGTGPGAVQIPPEVGEIDLLGVDSGKGLLVVLEAKMVNTGLEAKYWRDDVSTFVSGNNSYAAKFRKKIDWVCNRAHEISSALGHRGASLRVAPAMVTLYPCIAAEFITDFPCVSLAEFMLDHGANGDWPYPTRPKREP